MTKERKRQAALDYHSEGRPGKIEVVPTKPVATQRELSLAYTPGVAEPCRAIDREPLDVFKYTARGNLVAVVSNGTAVLGLGNIGPLAAKPVMEGKGVLFKRFAGIDVFDIEVDTEEPDQLIRFCQLLEPTVGGINLEDIRAPDCFVIEERLKETLDIPVFHDDQHGTAIIAGAALLNALEVAEKDPGEVRVVFSGAGASALSTAEHIVRLGVPRKMIVMVDSHGVIHAGREEGMNEYKARFAAETDARTLEEAMRGADVFVGLSVGGLVTPEMVASMAEKPIIFALANPDPEITPEEVAEVRDDAIMATGRSDYPNQVNNVLGFPFIFRGALDVRAREINEEMKLAATRALADLAREEVPESVVLAYGGEAFEFGRDYLIPKPFDPRVLFYVAPAVARAAMESGAARAEVNPDEYRDHLRASLGPGREVMRWMTNRARRHPARIVLPDGYNDRVIRAASNAVDEGVARPVLLGRPEKIEARAEDLAVSMKGVEVLHPASEESRRYGFADALYQRRRRKGMTLAEAKAKMYEPTWFGGMMVRTGDADGMVAGIDSNYPEVLSPVLQVVGRREGVEHAAGVYMVALPRRDLLFFADTTVNIDPDEEVLAEVALLTAEFVRELGITPRIAMLSFSNFGSARHPSSLKVRRAVELVKEADPELEIDGEMQADTAVSSQILRDVYSFSDLNEAANVLIFPTLGAANACYKLLAQLGGAEVIGPVLLGMGSPVHVLQRGSTAMDVLNLVTIASVGAQARSNQG
ncbi:MAG: NADP-dependent malic enzyme [Gemmatimonadetes bacterium]|nr:NADP-dependent malic enzyme [Gemmatimonadota bacterium]NIR79119.1 NADP-dependent malic enzyme [Gemmatimonadota bacterium]NIT87772.1 NADP-dependent malic enzyme [Gemmatimonadota bacterium]NIU31635.1 NADP-dependent malic enzyme [Gemmatimonadota bacterium]NIU36262.1 NADP-dependent malic enzyme [Gemmatimonadota bacterium]